jgi:dTDP-4-amino-4,6-dideoxygalactose transaminase
MRIGRTLPPAAAPLHWSDLGHALAGLACPARALEGLEEQVTRHFGVAHAFLVSSGTAALTLSLAALRTLSPRKDVVIPAYTCYSVPAAVLAAGLRPVPCDIDPWTFDFDHRQLEQAVGAETLCVVAHHLFGVPSDVERTRALCQRRGAFVLEDAAQAMGAEGGGRALGTTGDAGIFSLGRGKNITCGSGGVIVTSRADVAEAIAGRHAALPATGAAGSVRELALLAVMALFIRPVFYWLPAALPFLRLGETVFPRHIALHRLSGMKAGLLRDWRRRLVHGNRLRRRTAAELSRRLGLTPPAGPAHPYLRLPVLLASPAERERVFARGKRRGLGLARGYPAAVADLPELGTGSADRFPVARRVARTLVTIPTHHWLSERDKQAIADCFASAALAGPLQARLAS